MVKNNKKNNEGGVIWLSFPRAPRYLETGVVVQLNTIFLLVVGFRVCVCERHGNVAPITVKISLKI